ncbi:MAG TPA: hypothetical protein VHE80_08735 [Acidimicrobiales bacterium]|nr:hypothetical protein [Acidimicrobiales bacterium]
MTDDPGLDDPEAAGGKGPGEVPDATPSGHKAKLLEGEHELAPQGSPPGEKSPPGSGETPT